MSASATTSDPPPPPERFVASGFCLLRTPLLPLDDLWAWGDGLAAVRVAAGAVRSDLTEAVAADRATARARLRAIADRPEVREALWLASPGLLASLDGWRDDPDGKAGQRSERALVRYLARMIGRPTPFGLFAGVTLGAIGATTVLELEGRDRYRRHARLDRELLATVAEALAGDPDVRGALRFGPGWGVHAVGDELRHVAARRIDGAVVHRIEGVVRSAPLAAGLRAAADGVTPRSIAAAIADATPGVTIDDAAGFVDQLIDAQLLVDDLTPPMTADDPTAELVARLRAVPDARPVGDRLAGAAAALDQLAGRPLGVEPAAYREIGARLGPLPPGARADRWCHIDLWKPARALALGAPLVAELLRGVDVLRRFHRPNASALALDRFRRDFEERYDGRAVPLLEALDDDVGIGFASRPAGASRPAEADDPSGRASRSDPRDALLLRRVHETLREAGAALVLGRDDLAEASAVEPPALPDGFWVRATVLATDDGGPDGGGGPRALIHGAGGPSGGRLLGRFCAGSPELRRRLEAHLAAEDALAPDAIVAEVVHPPDGRAGNLFLRPALRRHEIPYVGAAAVPPDQRIGVDDLLIGLMHGRLWLSSRRRQVRVIPRLTSADNYLARRLPLYRFLCALQAQDVAEELVWHWGPLEAAPALPRVVVGRIILARARVTLGRAERAELSDRDPAARFAAAQRLRARHRLERCVQVGAGDRRTLLDLDNPLCVDLLGHLAGRPAPITLEETALGPPAALCARGPEGGFVHDVVVPFVRQAAAVAAAPARLPTPSRGRRRFAPGGEWLYAKLYGAPALADEVLRTAVARIVATALRTGAADRWFFLRYADPQPHLRLRLGGPPARLAGEVLPLLHRTTARLLGDGRLWRVQLDTYEREVERYGGPDGVRLAEELFWADSQAVLAIVKRPATAAIDGDPDGGDGGDPGDDRRRLTTCGVDLLLADLGLDVPARREVVGRWRAALARELRLDAAGAHRLGARFRRERAGLAPIAGDAPGQDGARTDGVACLRRRSRAVRPIGAALRELERRGRLGVPLLTIAGHHMHLHANRMLPSAARRQELVIYDFLGRLYDSHLARR